MHAATIQKLNQLNQELYRENAQQFSDTRATFWPGWQQLLPHLKTIAAHPLTILDIGCGNGRFANFLKEQLPERETDYTGVDSSGALLEIARSHTTNTSTQFVELDIIDILLHNGSLLPNKTFDLVVAFGVLHHIPSFELRHLFFQLLAAKTRPNGIVVITSWQFLNSIKQREHIVDPRIAGLTPEELEENDFILDWRAGETKYRYCHYLNNAEEIKLLKQSRLTVLDEYFADGSTKNLNHYLVMQQS